MGLRFLESKKMPTKDKIILFTSLSYMLTAGITLRDGVAIIMQDPGNKLHKRGLEVLQDSFDEGMTLSETLRKNEDIFGSGLWRQVEAAERTGKVPSCLLRIAEQFKSSSDVKGKVRGALAYPIFILVVALVAGYYLFTNTVPKMGAMMQDMGAELPVLTKMVMGVVDILTTYAVFFFAGLILLFGILFWMLKNPWKLGWHRFITRLPLAGPISINTNYSLIYLLLNDMIENGASAVEALRVAAGSAANSFIMNELLDCAETMEREGYRLARVLLDATTMPHDDRLMLNVGSQTGREMDVLQDLAARRRVAAEASIQRLLEMLSPIVMLLVCSIVGILVVAIYMPMITMASSMQ